MPTFTQRFMSLPTLLCAGALLAGCSHAPTVNGAPPSSGPKPPTCPQPPGGTQGDSVRFDSVRDRGELDYGDQVTGHVTLAPDHHLWIVTYAPAAGRWFTLGGLPDQQNGSWTSMPLYLGDGSGADNGHYFCLAALVVSPDGDREMGQAEHVGWFTQLPAATAHVITVRLRHGERKTTPPTCPQPPGGTPGDSVAFTSVHDGSPIDYGDRVTGRVALATGHHLWIMAYGPVVRLWFVFGDIPTPTNGMWTSMPIELGDGSGDDNGRYFCLGAFVLDPSTDADFRRRQSAAGNEAVSLTQLPPATAHIIVVQLRHGERSPVNR